MAETLVYDYYQQIAEYARTLQEAPSAPVYYGLSLENFFPKQPALDLFRAEIVRDWGNIRGFDGNRLEAQHMKKLEELNGLWFIRGGLRVPTKTQVSFQHNDGTRELTLEKIVIKPLRSITMKDVTKLGNTREGFLNSSLFKHSSKYNPNTVITILKFTNPQ